ncbi:hypothetical protein BDB01DRAFT_74850 [Pilobolus umbonatus]|nr:hypothetical protein BDB01DRAFT_74850 [Pilobolus umbonatus]
MVDTSSEQSYDEQDDSSILQQFYKYKKATEVSAKQRGFSVDSNLYEILLRSTLFTKYMHSKVKFDTNLYNQVSEILGVDNCFFLFLHRISVPKMAHGKQKSG